MPEAEARQGLHGPPPPTPPIGSLSPSPQGPHSPQSPKPGTILFPLLRSCPYTPVTDLQGQMEDARPWPCCPLAPAHLASSPLPSRCSVNSAVIPWGDSAPCLLLSSQRLASSSVSGPCACPPCVYSHGVVWLWEHGLTTLGFQEFSSFQILGDSVKCNM